MKPHITMLTLAVDDLERALRFYRDGMHLPTEGIVGTEFAHGAVAFFDLDGVKLALFPRENLAHDAGIPASRRGPAAVSMAHNVRSAEEVDAVIAEATAAGANVVTPARKTFWGGYAGYFEDLDGHLWEIAWNPALLPAD